MTIRSAVYIILVTLAVAGVAAVTVGVYRGGSSAVPGWIAAVQPGPLSAKHAFLASKCESCHTPVKGVEAAACISCHSSAAVGLGKQSTAFHATSRECGGCHLEHKGEGRPIRMDHASLLRTGSEFSKPGLTARKPAEQLYADLREFLNLPERQDTEKAVLNCLACHSNRDPHRGLLGADCAGCHELASWRIAQFIHPSPNSKDCAQCHQAPPSHYMGHFMMDKAITGHEHATVNQCFLCHRTDSFNDIKDVGWFKHH